MLRINQFVLVVSKHAVSKGDDWMSEEEIKGLIDQFYGEPGPDSFESNMARAKELKLHGEKVVDPILDELLQRMSEDTLDAEGSPAWHLLGVVQKLAEPRHASRAAELLSWEGLFLGLDRGHRRLMLQIIQKIGGRSEVPALEEFGRRIEVIEYDDYDGPSLYHPSSGPTSLDYTRWDQEEVSEAIAACRERPEASIIA